MVFLARTEQGGERGELRGKMGLETMVESDEANEFKEFLGTGRLWESTDSVDTASEGADTGGVNMVAEEI